METVVLKLDVFDYAGAVEIFDLPVPHEIFTHAFQVLQVPCQTTLADFFAVQYRSTQEHKAIGDWLRYTPPIFEFNIALQKHKDPQHLMVEVEVMHEGHNVRWIEPGSGAILVKPQF